MKKLSLLLLTLCLSLATWAGVDDWTHLNPFAYDLKSEVIENGTQLKLTYSLNATAVTSDTYNEDHHGLQIYLIDENGNRIKKEDGTTWACTSGSYQKGKDHSVIIPIADLPPAAKETNLSWEVVVHGNKNWTKPKAITSYLASQTATYKPRAGHGIAIEKDPNSKWFGRIYVAEACTNTSGKNSVLEYDMLFNYKTYHHKDKLDGGSSYFSSSVNYEPHRLKISKDGRMFATCYHPHAVSAVLEYMGNGEWRTVVKADEGKNDDEDGSQSLYPINEIYDCRPIAMDVKGSKDDLKIIVAWIKPKGRKAQNQWDSKIEIYEYNVGSNEATIQSNKGLDQDAGTLVGTYIESNTATNVTTLPNTCGLLFQAFFHTNDATPWVTEEHGLIDILYGEGADNPIWMKIDFACGSTSDIRRGQILYFNDSKKTFDYLTEKTTKYIYRMPNTVGTYCNYDGSYGGNAFYIKGDTLLTASGANTLLVYTGVKSKSLQYQTSISTGASPGIGAWTTGFAEDYAGNLYALSEEADNIVAFAMPYDGTRTTRANSTFTVSDPVPNILATDLRYEAVDGTNKYEFSFNVNTKPEIAQIRFYKDEAKMLANDANYDYYYEFPECKQGRMSVQFDMVGGDHNVKDLSSKKLPCGKLYWNVYVKTRESKVFAPIYTQANIGNDEHYRLHATIDNNPDNDGFGHIYAIDYNGSSSTSKIMTYTIGNENVIDGNNDNINYAARYKLLQKLSIVLHNPRRPAVAPDGSVFIADHGTGTSVATKYANGFEHGGIWVFNPQDAANKATSGTGSLIQFHTGNETTSGIAFYGSGNNLKMYKTNTYDEYTNHLSTTPNYQSEKCMENGFRIFNNIGNADGTVKHTINAPYTTGEQIAFRVQDANGKEVGGDAGGNISVKATSTNIWFCQHRENKVGDADQNPDNRENVALMCYTTDGNTRAFQSYTATVDGASLSQTTTSIMQSTPGAGMTVSPDEKFLYVVNHDGNILEFEITGTDNQRSLTHKHTYPTDYKAISSMHFDYAGNLVVTACPTNYPTPYESNIVIYTMPYLGKENARAIPAPKSCRTLPERLSHLEMGSPALELFIQNHPSGCAVDLDRPLQGNMFNTICLPFEVALEDLPETHPLYDATLKKFTDISLENINGENSLSLIFSDVQDNIISANEPYLIQPKEDINNIMHFSQSITMSSIEGNTNKITDDKGNSVDFVGVVPYKLVTPKYAEDGITPLTLLLVANNRLAALTSPSNMLGFRAYFQLEKPLPTGTQTRISTRRPTPTNNTIVVDGKKVNVDKYLREGRVYIRMDDQVYDLTGARVH